MRRSDSMQPRTASPVLMALIVAGLITAVIVASVGWRAHPVVEGGDARSALPIMGSNTELSAAPRVEEPLPDVAEEDASPALPSAREFLSSLYGDRWPELQARMEAKGVKLDQPYLYRPWEEVVSVFEPLIPMNDAEKEGTCSVMVQWPETLTDEWLKKNVLIGRDFASSEADRAAIADLVADLAFELELLADQRLRRIESIVAERWRTGDYLKAPFTTSGLSNTKGFYSNAWGSHGWAVKMTLEHADYPDVVALESQAADLRDQREERIHAYLLQYCLR